MTLDQALAEGAKIGIAACRRSRLIDRDDARQIGRIAAWKAWREYDGVRDFRRWLTTCVYWMIRRELRSRRKKQLPRPLTTDVAFEIERDGDCDSEWLRAAIAALPDVLRRCVELRFFSRCTLAQISELTCIPISTVQLKLSTAIEILRAAAEGRQ